jgi:hypothetical protein
MHRLVLAALVAALPLAARAAVIEPGTFEISGGSNFTVEGATTEFEGDPVEVETSTVGLLLSGAWYPIQNVGVGLIFDHRSITQEVEGFADFEASQTAIGPQVRFNVPLAPQLSLRFAAALGLVAGQEDVVVDELGNTEQVDFDGSFFQVGAGFSFFVTGHFSFDAGLTLERVSTEDDVSNLETTRDAARLGFGISVFL